MNESAEESFREGRIVMPWVDQATLTDKLMHDYSLEGRSADLAAESSSRPAAVLGRWRRAFRAVLVGYRW